MNGVINLDLFDSTCEMIQASYYITNSTADDIINICSKAFEPYALILQQHPNDKEGNQIRERCIERLLSSAHYYERGSVYSMAKAIACYSKVLKLKLLPNFKPDILSLRTIYFSRGSLYFSLEKYSEALEDMNRADCFVESADCYFKLKDYRKAIEYYKIYIFTNRVSLYHKIGMSHFELKEYEKALENYKKALDLDTLIVQGTIAKDFVFDNYNLYKILHSQVKANNALGRYQDSYLPIARIYDQLDGDLEFLYDRAVVHFHAKNYEKALEDINCAVKPSAEALKLRSHVYKELSNESAILAEYQSLKVKTEVPKLKEIAKYHLYKDHNDIVSTLSSKSFNISELETLLGLFEQEEIIPEKIRVINKWNNKSSIPENNTVPVLLKNELDIQSKKRKEPDS